MTDETKALIEAEKKEYIMTNEQKVALQQEIIRARQELQAVTQRAMQVAQQYGAEVDRLENIIGGLIEVVGGGE